MRTHCEGCKRPFATTAHEQAYPQWCNGVASYGCLSTQLAAATARAEAAEAKVASLLARRFPVLHGGMTVPWQMLVPHEPQAMRNHSGQTLEELAQRRGLDWVELACVLNGKPFTRYPTEHAKDFVLKRVAEYEAAQWVRENSPPQKKPTDEGGRGE